jgi:excisionase family DNA binding protein
MILTIREVAERMRVSASLVYRIVRSGALPCVRIGLGQGRLRILSEDLDDYLSKHRETGDGAPHDAPPSVRLKHLRVR